MIRARHLDHDLTPCIHLFPTHRYHDSPAFLTPVDFVNTLGLARMMGAGGAVVWGASADVKTEGQCLALKVRG